MRLCQATGPFQRFKRSPDEKAKRDVRLSVATVTVARLTANRRGWERVQVMIASGLVGRDLYDNLKSKDTDRKADDSFLLNDAPRMGEVRNTCPPLPSRTSTAHHVRGSEREEILR